MCVRVCVSPRPAVTAPSSQARGLPHQGAAWAAGDQPRRGASRWIRPWRAPALARLSPTCPGALGRARGEKERRFPSAAEHEEEEATAAARL